MADQTPITDEEAADMRARLASYDQQRMAETMQAQAAEEAAAQTAHDEKRAPLRAIVDQDAYAQIADDLRALLPEFVGEEPLFGMMKAMAEMMPKLKDWAAK